MRTADNKNIQDLVEEAAAILGGAGAQDEENQGQDEESQANMPAVDAGSEVGELVFHEYSLRKKFDVTIG